MAPRKLTARQREMLAALATAPRDDNAGHDERTLNSLVSMGLAKSDRKPTPPQGYLYRITEAGRAAIKA